MVRSPERTRSPTGRGRVPLVDDAIVVVRFDAGRQPPSFCLNSSQMSVRWVLAEVSFDPSSSAKTSSGGKTAGSARTAGSTSGLAAAFGVP